VNQFNEENLTTSCPAGIDNGESVRYVVIAVPVSRTSLRAQGIETHA
jgi:hypothetical protein